LPSIVGLIPIFTISFSSLYSILLKKGALRAALFKKRTAQKKSFLYECLPFRTGIQPIII
ncbi:MAG: hypothetical protein RR413_03405, partial [Christensenellaceae bacterium]